MPMLKRVWSRRHTVDAFGGLDRGARIGDGAFSRMENLCADFYPALGPRPGRVRREQKNVTALGAGEGLCYTQGKYLVLPDRKVDLGLTEDGPKKLVNMGAYVLVFPDKKYASTVDPLDFGALEACFPGEVAVTLTPCSLEGADRLPDYVQSVEPKEPVNKALWLDTSDEPQVLKEWSASSGLWIVVQTPYIICNRAMYDALEKAAGGTAQVQIITNAPQSGANPWGCADYLNQKKAILSTGVSICEWHGERSMHTKTILIDDRFSIVGSFNWDMRSAYLDTELMLLVDCPELNAALRAETDEMVRQGRLLLPDGTAVEGAAYTAPEMPLYKKLLQPMLRVVIRPFRYVL